MEQEKELIYYFTKKSHISAVNETERGNLDEMQEIIKEAKEKDRYKMKANRNEEERKSMILDQTVFESFYADNFYTHNIDQLKRLSSDILGVNSSTQPNKLAKLFEKSCPCKYLLLKENPVWQELELNEERIRKKLPFFKDPNQKLNIWNILKDSIGKDLSRFAVPVYLNEPLSMLQRFAEQFEYSDILDEANHKTDSMERMAYVLAFALTPYSATIARISKPFNPLLGETYELDYSDDKKKFRFFSEQVSHHPPISAGYCYNENFEFWANTMVKTSFKGQYIEVSPLGGAHVKLKKYKDHFVFFKAKTSVNNLIVGKIYVDNHGEMTCENHSTGDKGILKLTQRGWGEKGAYEVKGSVKNQLGIEKFRLKGRWDKDLTIINVETNEEKIIWKRYNMPEKYDFQFFFTDFALQLNHINVDLMKKIPPTDSRLRPDQRALEYGYIDVAGTEKLRLEEKQRAKRKEWEKTGTEYIPVYFKEQMDSMTLSKEYEYLGGYWEDREKGDFGKLLDIY